MHTPTHTLAKSLVHLCNHQNMGSRDRLLQLVKCSILMLSLPITIWKEYIGELQEKLGFLFCVE